MLCRSVLASDEDWFHISRSADYGLDHTDDENSWKLQHHKLLCDGMPTIVIVKNHIMLQQLVTEKLLLLKPRHISQNTKVFLAKTWTVQVSFICHLPLPHPFVLYAPLTGGSSLSLGLGQLWLNLDLFRLLALPFGIAFHHQLGLLSYHPIFLLPYHFLKLVSFLGANQTKSACWPMAVEGRYINTWIPYHTMQYLRAKVVKEIIKTKWRRC